LDEIDADALEFTNTQYREIIEQTKIYFNENGFIDEYFFRNNEATMHLASDIILDSQKYLLSPGWETNAEKIVKTDTDNYKEEVVYNLNYMKITHLNRLIHSTLQKIKEGESEENVKSLMEYYKQISAVRSELAGMLGIRIQ
jgi:hypothetical protein